jgi:hypothetical protein
MSWIESHQSLSRHKKTIRASKLLKTDRMKLIGHLHELWWWAIDNADIDGRLGDITAAELADAAGWTKDGEAFTAALIEARFVDSEGSVLILHNWFKYAGKLMEKREKDRDRKRGSSTEILTHSNGIPTELPKKSQAPKVVGSVGTVGKVGNAKKAVQKPLASKLVDAVYLQQIQPEHPTVNVCDVYENARNRTVWDGYKDQRRALNRYIGWAEEKVAQRGNGNGIGSNNARGGSFPQLTRAADAKGPGRTPDLVG